MMRRVLVISLIGAVLFSAWLLLSPSLATYLIVAKPLEKADVIVVLSGSAAYKERTRKAAELFQKGVAPRVIITDDGERGGWSQSERRNMPFVELEQRELIAGGVPPDAITILPGKVSGTDEEARAFVVEINARPINSLLLVTSAYHTRRALRTFTKILAGRGVEIGIEYAPISDQTPPPEAWWLGMRGWRTVGGEYIKSAVYMVWY